MIESKLSSNSLNTFMLSLRVGFPSEQTRARSKVALKSLPMRIFESGSESKLCKVCAILLKKITCSVISLGA